MSPRLAGSGAVGVGVAKDTVTTSLASRGGTTGPQVHTSRLGANHQVTVSLLIRLHTACSYMVASGVRYVEAILGCD